MYTQYLQRNLYLTISIYRYYYYSVSATAFFSPRLENIFFKIKSQNHIKSIIEFYWLFLENVLHNCPFLPISTATFLIPLPYFIVSDFVLGNQIIFLKTYFMVPPPLFRLPGLRETRVRSLGREDPLEKEMATHSSTLAWRIPWREEPGRLQSMGSQRVRHDWATSLSFHFPFFSNFFSEG